MMTEIEKHSYAWFILSGVFANGLKWRLKSERTDVALGETWIPKNQQQVYDALRL